MVKTLLKHILYTAISLNLGIFILWQIIQLAYLKIKDRIHKNFESELKSLKGLLHQLQMQHLTVNNDNQTMKDHIKTISNDASQCLVRQMMLNANLKLHNVNNIINIFSKYIK